MEKYYNKLVRDNIPKIIENQGNYPVTSQISDKEYLLYLNKKLKEETDEYLEGNNIEEICDIIEVVEAIAAEMNYSKENYEEIRRKKALKNGTFKDKILLEKIIFNDNTI